MLLIMLLVMMTAITGTSLVYASHAHKSRVRRDLPTANPTPVRELKSPTKTDRWLMEQEHELNPNAKFNHKGCRVCGPGPLGLYEIPSVYDHVMYGDVPYRDSYGHSGKTRGRVSSINEADNVTSEIEGTNGKWHTPMLDLDNMGVRVLESSTPGHHHLYIDKPVTWRQYKKILRALSNAQVIEPAFYKFSIKRKATHLRVPWNEKDAVS